jgi:hypothetical protein
MRLPCEPGPPSPPMPPSRVRYRLRPMPPCGGGFFGHFEPAVERNPELKVLYTTGQTVTDGMKALFVPNCALLTKPYTVEQLHTILAMKFGIKPNSAASPHT